MQHIYRLKAKVQNYAWGSKTMLSKILGKSESSRPEAEMWLGAHPKAPAEINSTKGYDNLEQFIAAEKEICLGKFENYDRLPFLMKVLTAAAPLSIQAHPSLQQAAEGFTAENAAGIPLNAFNRNYKDDNHKPELICALTEFDAMCGFRRLSDLVELINLFSLEEDLQLFSEFEENPEVEQLIKLFEDLMNLPKPVIAKAVTSLVKKAEEFDPISRRDNLLKKWILKLNEFYPGDVGVFAPVLLHTVTLQPGEALYLAAGELHAYLHGAGIEVMANSDNVLRGGLTPKHVDVPELLKTLTFRAESLAIIEPEKLSDGEEIYHTEANEFELSRIVLRENRIDRVELKSKGGEILFCLEGEINISCAEEALLLKKGESIFITGNTEVYTVDGSGTVYRTKTVK